MLVYILKFSACLGIFLAFYKLFLEKENMHQFKRFYLIGIVLTSMVIPFITFTEYVEPQPFLDDLSSTNMLATETTVSIAIENATNYLPMVLWSIYGIGVLLFGLKFGYNLVQMALKIKKNPKQKTPNFINVLLKDMIAPHTFFSYIFLNKHKYETHQIPQEVLLHEQTHAKQKHSLDVLFVEILQVIFWFHPLIHFLKKSIKLNHEFLADKAVLNKGIKSTNYQLILLAFSANTNEPELANAINYSSIKKRITVMKTHTSKQKIWLRSLVLLPLLALSLYSFSERKELVKEKNQLELLQKNNTELPVEITSQIVNENQDGASREQIKEYERLAKHYNSLPEKQRIIKQKDVERMKYIYGLMNTKQKKNAEPFPNIPAPPAPMAPKNIAADKALPPPPPPPIPENATAEQKEKYKKVTEEYKRKYTVKNGRVSENPPPPPPPIPENATPEQRKKYEEAIRRYKITSEKSNQQTQVRDVRNAETETLKKAKLAYQESREAKLQTEKNELAIVREKQIEERKAIAKQNNVIEGKTIRENEKIVGQLGRLQSPRSPLDHVIEMAKKDATFYLEGKKISSDKAIETLKNNKSLNIETIGSDSKQPKVYITKKPIEIKNNQAPKPTAGNIVSHVKVMNRHNAKFYLDGKEVSYNDALKAVRKNKNADINSTLEPAVVKINSKLVGVLGKS